MTLVEYKEYLVSTVDTDGLVAIVVSMPCVSSCLWVTCLTPAVLNLFQGWSAVWLRSHLSPQLNMITEELSVT